MGNGITGTLDHSDLKDVSPVVQKIPVTTSPANGRALQRIVRYDVPLSDRDMHSMFAAKGVQGALIDVAGSDANSDRDGETVQMVRYEVPSDQILLHSEIDQRGVRGEIVELNRRSNLEAGGSFLAAESSRVL